jgi:hypothetical protein
MYGGGPKGGPQSEAVKLRLVKRLMRMIVRVVLGPHKVAEYDALMARIDNMSAEELEADIKRAKADLAKTWRYR